TSRRHLGTSGLCQEATFAPFLVRAKAELIELRWGVRGSVPHAVSVFFSWRRFLGTRALCFFDAVRGNLSNKGFHERFVFIFKVEIKRGPPISHPIGKTPANQFNFCLRQFSALFAPNSIVPAKTSFCGNCNELSSIVSP